MPSEKPSENDKQQGGPSWRQAITGIGLVLAIPWMIGVPAVIGYYIDKKYGTEPLWFLVGLFIGLVGTAFDVYKLLKRLGQLK